MNITGKITALATKTIFKIKKASPEILIGVGVAGVITAVALAIKATPDAEQIVAEHKEQREALDNKFAEFETQNKNYNKPQNLNRARGQELIKLYLKTVAKLARNYAIPFSILLASLSAIVGSHVILEKRNVQLLAAYKALDESFKKYREQFNDALPKDNRNEDAAPARNDDQPVVPPAFQAASPYAKFFDELNPNWTKDPSANLFFLKAQEQFANDKFQAQGYLFLNDVYDSLGIPRTSFGQLVGWFKGNGGDEYIDFGIFDGDNESKRAFVNGYERSVLLDFNVDGVIYDLI